MTDWFMLTLVGRDAPGIVAAVSKTLYERDCNIGEATMTRLGGNFSMMLMVKSPHPLNELERLLAIAVQPWNLMVHLDAIDADLHRHIEPDVRISIYGADRAGIVATATGALAKAGLNILNLETDVGGTEEQPIFIMHIEGVAEQGLPPLEEACTQLARAQQVETHLSPIDTLMG
ncbi:glycine cleavage system protein R [Nitrospina watsonii]|uniref:Glycine cleavage system transcriptional antiactivator GcvR n=1 Tax=Nitrospina watsonii TaxID=1323948 RepID=A0ABM9HA51_9BACT|nr:ACT domain-containing protein [Nitrospina watsonii]CAI2716991.1 Glycine cleavage system transcriptional antiactivator GcvR [Nitrospina watsonii]